MPCFTPLKGWYSRIRNETGKRSIVFKRGEGLEDRPVTVPCGKCIGCRLDFARSWATRCVHESQLYEENCFITLTYDDEHLPEGGTLVKKHFQDFMRSLRHHIDKEDPGRVIKFFMCGEYGTDSGRPHYHAIIFNYDFKDKVPCLRLTDTGHFDSPLLNSLWTYGFTSVGKVDFNSCAYVARYCLKKVDTQGKVEKNSLMSDYYSERKPDGRLNEYLAMSRPRKSKSGKSLCIGAGFYYKFGESDIYDRDRVVVKHKLYTCPPKRYDFLLGLDNPEKLIILKRERQKRFANSEHTTEHRLFQRGRCAFLKVKQNRRDKL